MNQTTIAGKSSLASLLHGKRRTEAKIGPQRVDVICQLKSNVPCMLVAVRMAAPSSSSPCAGPRTAAREKSLLLAYLKEIV
jgi:hypothetical protein